MPVTVSDRLARAPDGPVAVHYPSGGKEIRSLLNPLMPTDSVVSDREWR